MVDNKPRQVLHCCKTCIHCCGVCVLLLACACLTCYSFHAICITGDRIGLSVLRAQECAQPHLHSDQAPYYNSLASFKKAIARHPHYRGLMEPFEMESFKIDFLAKLESLRRNITENIFSKTGIFWNGIFQKESFRKYFQQNRNLTL
jgi:hypothetical protein